MRLKFVNISNYKNLKDFSINFESDSFIEIFVGKNAAGKSNFFEALIEIFRHLYEYDKVKSGSCFDFKLKFELEGEDTDITWTNGQFIINGENRKTIGKTPLPDNVLIYYSGHNNTVAVLVENYEKAFRKRIKKADFGDSRRFIGIGQEYKELLLSVLLMQKIDNKARQFIVQKLGIKTVAPEVIIVLKRPAFADKKLKIDNFEPKTHYWGAEGITRQFLDQLVTCIKGEFNHNILYKPEEDRYQISINIELFQDQFNKEKAADLFRQFDNLKTLDMLAEISVPLLLENELNTTIAHFSDGQFQSIYIYSIVELFKDRNCITLLDEPDSFLHPEWQFDFLTQVFDITDAAGKKNHVLMSSHSASTITRTNDNLINLFEINGNNVVVKRTNKSDVIKSLSAGLISFSESEARLNIHHVLKNTTGAILFTEGITDEVILEIAWTKLYPLEKREFEIQNAFSCGFLRNLMKENTLYQNYPERTFFSLFDFDEAYNDWSQLGQDIQTDPYQCLVKKHPVHNSYALLLPVPANPTIQKQVINPPFGGNYGNKSLLTIEHLFYGIEELNSYFTFDTKRPGGFIKFISDGQKVKFANDIVPNLDVAHFDVFRPIFEFIKSKCRNNANPKASEVGGLNS
ncbi:MAG: AAA family ATPase [Methylococcaceae bacterium]